MGRGHGGGTEVYMLLEKSKSKCCNLLFTYLTVLPFRWRECEARGLWLCAHETVTQRACTHKTLEAARRNQSHLAHIRRAAELRPCVDLGNPQICFERPGPARPRTLATTALSG